MVTVLLTVTPDPDFFSILINLTDNIKVNNVETINRSSVVGEAGCGPFLCFRKKYEFEVCS